ncbi:hypothetical protein BRC94_11350 [Halobacteriales archaeon QS_5_70_17]|nr:MAG: hypothetical protein BRC94_11350 [Halobacteriales archaeon QS_5_70_17]
MDAALTVEGRDVLFAHWPIDPDRLRPHVPDPLALDTRNGRAWVGALAHRIAGVDPRGPSLPAASARSLPGALRAPLSPSFAQLNVRTYVEHGGREGVYFLDCETGAPLVGAVARRAFGLPFRRADVRLTDRGDRLHFRSRRSARAGDSRTDPDVDVRFDARYRPAGAVERDPWRVAPADATVLTNTVFEALGVDGPDRSTDSPAVHYSPGFEMTATRPRPVQTATSPEP